MFLYFMSNKKNLYNNIFVVKMLLGNSLYQYFRLIFIHHCVSASENAFEP